MLSVRGPFLSAAGYPRGEARMFMKTRDIVELTCNVIENKRVVRSPWSVAGRRVACGHVANNRWFRRRGAAQVPPPKKRGTKPECPLASTTP